ncbi:hypothetical protein V6N11_079247 [Hibiscus sabdariffa]|uniref:Uncharacterized protein n=1 Tax=Hibiscus sabdariffa TaxID=183260 RepID=A0ABR2RV05_9ROSI
MPELAENMRELAEAEDALLESYDEDEDPDIVAANADVDAVATNAVLPATVAANTAIPDVAAAKEDDGEGYRLQWYEFIDDESEDPGD